MNKHAEKAPENKSQPAATNHKKNNPTNELTVNSQESMAQRQLQQVANNNPEAEKAAQLRAIANQKPAQLKKEEEEKELVQGKFKPIQRKENNTGLPDNIKSGIESLSGYSMDDVKVHYNSGKPAQLNAHAYAQGTDIHVASGQEQHVAHEAWHVVQQKQGRVKPTMQLQNKVSINDDEHLEKEADVMGAKALQMKVKEGAKKAVKVNENSNAIQAKLVPSALNVVGEFHPESDKQRQKEITFSKEVLKAKDYWKESEFRLGKKPMIMADKREVADPFELRILQGLNFFKQEIETPKSTYMSSKEWRSHFNAMCSNIQGGSDGNELRKDVQNYYKNDFSKIVEGWKKKEDEEVSNQIDELLKTLVPFVSNNRKIEKEQIEGTKKVSNERSLAMHEAANQEAGRIGVWKVGDDHAKDMMRIDKRKYEVTLRDDFKKYLDMYNSSNKKKSQKTKDVLDEQDRDVRKELIKDLKDEINTATFKKVNPNKIIDKIKTRVTEKEVAEALLNSKELEIAFNYLKKKEEAQREEESFEQLNLEKEEFDKKQQTEETQERKKKKRSLEFRNQEIEILSGIMSELMIKLEKLLKNAKIWQTEFDKLDEKSKNLNEDSEQEKKLLEEKAKQMTKEEYDAMTELLLDIEKANEKVKQAGMKINDSFVYVWENKTKILPSVDTLSKDSPWDEESKFEEIYKMLKNSPVTQEKYDTSDNAIIAEVIKDSKTQKQFDNWHKNVEKRQKEMAYSFDRKFLTNLEEFLKSVQ